jgi:hypothetical protein
MFEMEIVEKRGLVADGWFVQLNFESQEHDSMAMCMSTSQDDGPLIDDRMVRMTMCLSNSTSQDHAKMMIA